MVKKKDGTDIFFFTYKAETYPCAVVQWFNTFEDLPDEDTASDWDVTGMPAPTLYDPRRLSLLLVHLSPNPRPW
jgi:hypothetical protein